MDLRVVTQRADVRFADNTAARFLIRETIRHGEKQSREVVRGMDETPLEDPVHTSSRSMLISMVVAHCAITSAESLSRSVKSFIDDFATIYANAARHWHRALNLSSKYRRVICTIRFNNCGEIVTDSPIY